MYDFVVVAVVVVVVVIIVFVMLGCCSVEIQMCRNVVSSYPYKGMFTFILYYFGGVRFNFCLLFYFIFLIISIYFFIAVLSYICRYAVTANKIVLRCYSDDFGRNCVELCCISFSSSNCITW